MKTWEISFYDHDNGMTVKCIIKAASFDEALEKARRYDPHMVGGCVID